MLNSTFKDLLEFTLRINSWINRKKIVKNRLLKLSIKCYNIVYDCRWQKSKNKKDDLEKSRSFFLRMTGMPSVCGESPRRA